VAFGVAALDVSSMRWVRSNIQLGARLALFALALQLVLSFGHIHLSDLLGPGAPIQTAAAAPASGDSPAAPAPSKKSNGAGDVCAICALIQLVNSSVHATAPSLPAPSEASFASWQTAFDFITAPSLRRAFSARAPPLA
jgi:Protein of unknown function (DUF2946)